MTTILSVRDLVKDFGALRAVDGINLDVARGQCLGLLGPNGAGKTTTIEIMEGIKPPTSGEVLYKNQSLGLRFRREAGMMFQSTALQEFITVREILRMFQRFYAANANVDELIERLNLREFLNSDAKQISGGQRQRLLLALALINGPEIVFLDEPTTGLDPQARRNLWDLVQDIKRRGCTIVMSTHYMDEAYQLCDQIAIIDHGRIIAQGSPDALLAHHFQDVVIRLPAASVPSAARASMNAQLRGDFVEVTSTDVNKTLAELLSLDVQLGDLRIRSRNLEDLFLELTGKDLRS